MAVDASMPSPVVSAPGTNTGTGNTNKTTSN